MSAIIIVCLASQALLATTGLRLFPTPISAPALPTSGSPQLEQEPEPKVGAGAESTPADDHALLGPVLGDLTPTSVRIWGRVALGLDDDRSPQTRVELSWQLTGDEKLHAGVLNPSAKRDGTFVLDLNGLVADTEYTLTFSSSAAAKATFRTRKRQGEIHSSRLAFGSCSSHDRFGEQPIWTAIGATRPSTLVLLGDTPYIDSTDLDVQRTRYVEFWSIPELRPLVARIPVVATWDDHDFATNDQVGAQEGREQSRQAFVEFHPQGRFGDGKRGVYSSFRDGPVEVFVLDTRWFGDEEPLGETDEPRSLLGKRQREWLIARLVRSTAPIKVLACGMVWNDAVRPGKRDHWGMWAAERDAIFAALRDAESETAARGIVLVGGDIHRPRVIRHVGSASALGYAPLELISSPLANSPIVAAAAPHPGLVWDAEAASVALILDVVEGDDGSFPQVTARFIDEQGLTLHEATLSKSDLGLER